MVDPKTIAQLYRQQAARCRRLAGQTTDDAVAKRLIELAEEFEYNADQIENNQE